MPNLGPAKESSRSHHADSRTRVVVWDANPFNPYGAEVARVVASLGYSTLRYCRRGQEYPSEGVRHLPALPAGGGGRHRARQALALGIALARMSARVLSSRAVLIVPWLEPFERPAIALLSALRVPMVAVVHNPIATRDDHSRITRFIRGRSTNLVHSEALLRLAPVGSVVASHPSYRAWHSRARGQSEAELESQHAEKRFLYLGAVRPDKGWDLLPEISARLPAGSRLVIAVGVVSPEERKSLADFTNCSFIGDGQRYLSDKEVLDQLKRADVLIAPYREVTVSGTAIMALTVGTPVVAFDSVGMRDLVPEANLAPPGDIQALCTKAMLAAASAGAEETLSQLEEGASRGWRKAIQNARRR